MSRQLLAIDRAIVEQCNLAAGVAASEHGKLVSFGIDLLEGKDISNQLVELAQTLGISNVKKLSGLVTSFSALTWECAKATNNINNSSRDTTLLATILVQLGMDETLVGSFCKEFNLARRRLNILKGNLSLSVLSYRDLQWRLDIELSKRALLVTTEPTYQLRLDLIKNDGKVTGSSDQEGSPTENIASYNLQCDYANLKNIQNELQKAIDAYTGVHSQRITRYIA
eukprot:gene13718-9822_t